MILLIRCSHKLKGKYNITGTQYPKSEKELQSQSQETVAFIKLTKENETSRMSCLGMSI